MVYTKRWVVELLLDLAGYKAENNLVDALAIEPAAGDGAFLGLMVERLLDSCRRLERPVSDCRESLIAYELDDASAARARAVDPAFDKASYSRRYELLCRRLVLERVYSATCFVMATNSTKTVVTQPAEDLCFKRFVAALRGHVTTFMESVKK